jgi:hypothetical protein
MAAAEGNTMTATEWSVLVEFLVARDDPVEVWIDDALDILEGYAAAISAEPGRVAVRLSIDDVGDEIQHAGGKAIHLVGEMLMKCGLDPIQAVLLEVATADDLDVQLSQPTFPVLLGVAEVAEMLNVTKQRASELAKTGTFPRPVAELAAGPVWTEPIIQQFVETWRRKPGRPAAVNADA